MSTNSVPIAPVGTLLFGAGRYPVGHTKQGFSAPKFVRHIRAKAEIQLCVTVTLLQGCSFEPETPPVLGSEAETHKVVTYYSDGDFDYKSVGEWMLLDTGESLQIKRNRIRPPANLMVNDWSQYEKLRAGPALPGYADIKVDRLNGIACLDSRCAHLYAICPPRSATSDGQVCKIFNKK